MATGDTLYGYVYCTNSSGTALSLDKTAFDGKYTIAWRKNGASLAAPTYTITDAGEGWHEVAFTAVSGAVSAVFTEDGSDLIEPSAVLFGEQQSYDLDSLGALLSASGGTSSVQTTQTVTLRDVVENDSYRSQVITIAATQLTNFGLTDLDDFDTITCGAKQVETDTAVAIDVTVISASSRTVQLEWDTWISGLDRTNTDGTPETWYIQIQGNITGPPAQVITLVDGQFNVVWDRND